jgi:hypothetical protein
MNAASIVPARRPRVIFHAAVIKEKGVSLAVISVEPHLLKSMPDATKIQIAFAPVFPGLPIVLVSQDATGFPIFHGRKDLITILSNIQLHSIPWREYSYGR